MTREKQPQWKLDDCACVVDAARYIKMCTKHERESQEIHERWAADKIRMEKEQEDNAIKESKVA